MLDARTSKPHLERQGFLYNFQPSQLLRRRWRRRLLLPFWLRPKHVCLLQVAMKEKVRQLRLLALFSLRRRQQATAGFFAGCSGCGNRHY